jgi:hypothetical protein
MNLTAWAVLGLAVGLGQAPAAKDAEPAGITLGAVRDVHPTKSRTHMLDIVYPEGKRNLVAHVELLVSRDEGQTWAAADAVKPDKDHLNLIAKEDGLYFVNLVFYFKDGSRDPKDPARETPEYKMLIDSTPPVVKIVAATRQGDDVLLDWTIDEKYLNEAATQVLYKASANPLNEWTPVPPSAVNKRSAKFKPAVAGPVIVRVIASDYAENKADVARELPAGVVTASYTPAVEPPAPVIPSSLPAPAPVPVVLPSGPPVVPGGGPTVVMPAGPVPALSPVPTMPVPTQPAAASPLPSTPPPVGEPGLPTGAPLATTGGAGNSPPTASAPAPVNPPQYLRGTDFDMQYEIENNGPSGLSRVDLYVTRDQGQTWTKWSSHPGKERPLKVKLGRGYDTNKDGEYGLKLVPVSGVGIADDAPTAGTPPDHRVVVDTAAPLVLVYPHGVAPNQPNAVALNWVARDANFGTAPITIEWGETPTGPWKSVVAPDVAQAGAGAGVARLPNTGQYLWTLPAGMPTHRVYLRVTATDRAGNRSEVVTREPITVDLMKPKARIVAPAAADLAPRP